MTRSGRHPGNFLGRSVTRLLAVLLVASACTQATPPPQPTALPTAAPDTGPPVVDRQAPPQPLIVSAAYVRSGGSKGAVVAQPTIVSAHALAQDGVAALELWDGTELVAVENADPAAPSPAFYARWEWLPPEAGVRTLFVRAVDFRGRVAQSNAVRVAVGNTLLAPPAGGLPSHAIALAGSGLAADFDAGRRQVGYGINVPAVQATLDGCTLELAANDVATTASGIVFYGLAPSGLGFTPLATLGPDAARVGQEVTLTGHGSFMFSASAFDDVVEAFSAPVEIVAPPECGAGGWSGDVSLEDGMLQSPQAVDRAYMYVTQGDGAAVRVPTDQGQFVVVGQGGSLDFGPLLPALDSSAFEIEAWGWQQGALIYLGMGRFTPPPPSGNAGAGGPITFGGGPPQFSGAMATSLKVLDAKVVTGNASPDDACSKEFCVVEEPVVGGIIERPPVGSTKPIVKKFQWKTSLANISQFVWQILPYPPAGSADLAPPFLVDHGVTSVASGQSEGEFSIDFNKYFQASVPMVNQQQAPAGDVVLAPIFGTPGSPSPTPTPTGGGGNSNVSLQIDLAALGLGAFDDRFYVRVIPIQFNSALLPSNFVTLDVVEPAAPIQIVDPHAGEGVNQNAYTIQWTYSPPVGADPKYARCALVKSVSSSVPAPWSQIYKNALSSGKPLCYEPPDDDGWSPFDAFEAFVEFVSDVWDYVADGYAWIKKKVVELALTAVPCSKIASQAVCETIANTALDAALASFGVPPSLPNFDAVVAGLKGDLATLIVESASGLPGVSSACGLADAGQVVSDKVKTCEELAAVAIDAIVKEMEKARSDAAGQASGWGFPGVTLVSDPRGQFQPPSFKVTLTRTADPALPKTCSLQVYMKSTKKNWTFPELHQGWVKNITADVTGEPFVRTSMLIKPLAPGQSLTRELWLTKTAIWFESWRAQLYWHYYEALLNTDYSQAWVLLTGGSELTFAVESNCAKPSIQGPHVLPASAYDSSG